MLRTRLRGLLCGAAGAAVLPAALGGSTAAATVVPLPMGVFVTTAASGTALEVCAYGQARSTTSRWELHVTGVRLYNALGRNDTGDGTLISLTRSWTTPTFGDCLYVPFDGAPAGHVHATLVYTGTGEDVIGALGGRGTWALGTSDGNGVRLGGPPMPE